MKIKKAVEISDAKIQFVSLVDRPANGRPFLIAKNKKDEGQADFFHYGRIVKVDDQSHFLTGIVYEPFVEDAHGNFMTDEEIRKAAYWFAKNGDRVDIQHSFRNADGVFVVENYLAPCDMEIGGEKVAKGSWLMSVEVCNKKIWEAVQKGKIKGFSMGGLGRYAQEETSQNEVRMKKKAHENDAKAACGGILKRLAEILGSENVPEKKESQGQEGDEMTRQEVQEMIDESIKNALKNLQKSRGISTNLDDEDFKSGTFEKQEGHFLKGFI